MDANQYIPTISEVVFAYGIEVFGNLESFQKWMNCEMLHLEGMRPRDLAIEDILEEIMKFEEGKY